MSELKYKVGDKVRIKDIGWYNENKNEDGDVELSTAVFLPEMSKYCGTIVTIKDIFYDNNDIVLYQMDGGIIWGWTDEMIEGLVERNGKTYPYKIGDRVVLKGNNRCATITDLKYNSWGNLSYYIKIDNDKDISTDYPTELLLPYNNMSECKMEGETKIKYEDEKNGESKPKYEDEVNGEFYSTPKYLVRPSGYQFVDENGNVINATKIVLEKKKKEYPKTYEECCKVLGFENTELVFGDDYSVINTPKEQWKILGLINQFNKLLICRNAYWKLYGEEIGLGKPWEPSKDKMVYSIYRHSNEIGTEMFLGKSVTFEFPTAEMRNFFKENFDPDIEICKELL